MRRHSGVAVAVMVAAAGAFGVAGLVAGRRLATTSGGGSRRRGAMAAIAGCGVPAYRGTRVGLVAGYTGGVLAGSVFASRGALINELSPTAVRASVAGWQVAAGVFGAVCGLIAFGAVADVDGRFAVAAVVTFIPAVLFAGLFWALPETKGREPEDLWTGA